MAEFPAPAEGIVLTHFIAVSDAGRSRHFYAGVPGGEVLREGEPSIIALAAMPVPRLRRTGLADGAAYARIWPPGGMHACFTGTGQHTEAGAVSGGAA